MLPWVIMSIGSLGEIGAVFRRAFSTVEEQPTCQRPTGYKWGRVFAAVVGLGGVGCWTTGAVYIVSARLGSTKLTSLTPPQILVIAFVSAVLGSELLAMSVCAFVRRYPACYLVVTIGLVVNVALAVTWSVLGVVQGRWSSLAGALIEALGGMAWLAYFANRRHMFGYLHEEPE